MKKSQIVESDIFSHFISLGYLPRWIVLIIDVLLCAFSLWVASALVMGVYVEPPHFESLLPLWAAYLLLVCVCVTTFWMFHTYSGILRYSNFVDIVKVMCAVLGQFVAMFCINEVAHALGGKLIFMRWTLVFYAIVAFLLLLLLRMSVKVLFDYLVAHNGQMKPVAVYGTKSAGIGIAKMIRSSDNLKFRLAAFIDDVPDVNKKNIFGVQVLSTHNADNLLHFLAKHKIRTIVVSPIKLKEIDPETDLDIFIENNIEVLTVPSMNQWHENSPMPATMRPDFKNLQIEDLLERPAIEIEKSHIVSQLQGKVVMITGAAGSIGSEIVRQLVNYKPKLIVLYDNAETPLHNLRLELEERKTHCPYVLCIGDMRNRSRLENVITTYRPNIIYHAAAYKHVPMMEDAPSECVMANVMGTRYIADLAVENGVEAFVMVSTDKAVNPTNVMGASKRIAEIYVQSLFRKMARTNASTTKFITTRFGNVLGSNGSVIPLFRHQIEKGGPVTVTHPDIIRYFMTIPEACQLVLEAGSMGEGGEIFVFDMGRPVKIVDLARKMIRLAGYRPEIDIPITYTGLRPGEKLYEELLNAKEVTQPTYNEKILIATVREYEFDDIVNDIDRLIEYARLYKSYLVVSQMKRIVPEFISKNSQFERLDIESNQQ
ncbi:MAG: nucleoside-diphosphate sugar epimerase/dehydratase [Paludibacteraceae bacterium]|nr:polysaccharide biosynthesis protein [Bacteroidales bacterium]MDY4850309.1 nucleoside-diphosphate sugar epimerase/dehydratase [Paludibacteraceae bacterium]